MNVYTIRQVPTSSRIRQRFDLMKNGKSMYYYYCYNGKPSKTLVNWVKKLNEHERVKHDKAI